MCWTGGCWTDPVRNKQLGFLLRELLFFGFKYAALSFWLSIAVQFTAQADGFLLGATPQNEIEFSSKY